MSRLTVELPDGRTVPLPPCPRCGATASRCRRPSGHDAAAWHDERETALAMICRCDDRCQRWLDRHVTQQLMLVEEVAP